MMKGSKIVEKFLRRHRLMKFDTVGVDQQLVHFPMFLRSPREISGLMTKRHANISPQFKNNFCGTDL